MITSLSLLLNQLIFGHMTKHVSSVCIEVFEFDPLKFESLRSFVDLLTIRQLRVVNILNVCTWFFEPDRDS